jgi:putative membrane protein
MLRKFLLVGAAMSALTMTPAFAQEALQPETRQAPPSAAAAPTPLPMTDSATDGEASSTSAAPTWSNQPGPSGQAAVGGPSTGAFDMNSSDQAGAPMGIGTTQTAVDASGAVIAAAPIAVAPKTDLDARTFAMKAAAGDLFEIESSRVALERSQSGAVRRYAQMMIDHHAMTSQQLMRTVRDLPAPRMEEHQRDMVAKLRAAPADQFDATYMRQQLASHMSALSLHGGYLKAGDEPALRRLAGQATPIVASHLEQAWTMTDMPRNLAAARGDTTALAQASGGGRTYRGYTVYGPNARPEVSAGVSGSLPDRAVNPPADADAMSNSTAVPGATVARSSVVEGSTAVPGQDGTTYGAGARSHRWQTMPSDAVVGTTVPNDRTGMGDAATRLGPTSPMNGTAGANTDAGTGDSAEEDAKEQPTP